MVSPGECSMCVWKVCVFCFCLGGVLDVKVKLVDSFLVNLLFAPAVIHQYPGSCSVHHWSLTVFNKHSWGKGCLPWMISGSDQINRALCLGSYRQPLDRSNENSLGMGLWNFSNPILPPPMASRLLVFTIIVSCWFSGAENRWMGIGQVKMLQSLLFWDSAAFLK